jgi:hypothetical protein
MFEYISENFQKEALNLQRKLLNVLIMDIVEIGRKW